MKKWLPVLVMVTAFSLVCLGCGDSGTGPSETYTVSGTLNKLDIADGVLGYAVLGTMGPDSSLNLIYTCESLPFDGGSASYTMSGVAAGTYYFMAVIDVNGNFTWDGPDLGDWVAGMDWDEVTIDQDTVINVTENDWELWSGGGPVEYWEGTTGQGNPISFNVMGDYGYDLSFLVSYPGGFLPNGNEEWTFDIDPDGTWSKNVYPDSLGGQTSWEVEGAFTPEWDLCTGTIICWDDNLGGGFYIETDFMMNPR